MDTKGRSWEYLCEIGRLQTRNTIYQMFAGDLVQVPLLPPTHIPSALSSRGQNSETIKRQRKGNNSCLETQKRMSCKEITVCPKQMLMLLLLSCQGTSVVSDSVRPHRRQPTRLPRPWDSPGKNTGVGCHFLLQYMKVKSESEVAQSCLTLSDPMD